MRIHFTGEKMKLTNKHNIPQVFVNAIERDDYAKGEVNLSVTELINSPRIVQLKRLHWNELEEDVSDKIFALMGKGVHHVLEHGKEDGSIREQRLYVELNGWKISGAIDLQTMEDGKISIVDHKVTGAWAVMNTKSEWETQLNCYAYLVEKVKKIPIGKLSITAIIRDWNKRDAKTKADYPAAPIKVIDIPLWSFEDRENFIKDRISLHSNAHFSSEVGEDYVFCTSSEMWESPTTYAIKKIGNKRATAVYATQEEAEENLKDGYEMETRSGERRRCADYCQVNQFCSQYQQYLMEQL
jgi:hypothetical protein